MIRLPMRFDHLRASRHGPYEVAPYTGSYWHSLQYL